MTLSGAYMVFQGSTFVELLLTEVWQAGTLHSDLCAHVWTCRLGCVMAVLDLHIEAAAHHAVHLMLGSSVFTSQASTGTSGAAFFCIHLQEGVSSHYEPLAQRHTVCLE